MSSPAPHWHGQEDRRGSRRSIVLALSVVFVVVLAITLTVVLVRRGDDGQQIAGAPMTSPTALPTTPAPSTPSMSSTPSTSQRTATSGAAKPGSHIPGWQTVTDTAVTYDVPPNWTVREETTADGVSYQRAVYQPGYCPGHENSVLGAVYVGGTDIQPASESVRTEVENHIRRQFGDSSPQINWGRLNTDDEDVMAVIPAEVRVAQPGTCGAPSTLVLGRAWSNLDIPGGGIFLVVADQEVPNAEAAKTLETIMNSFRFSD